MKTFATGDNLSKLKKLDMDRLKQLATFLECLQFKKQTYFIT